MQTTVKLIGKAMFDLSQVPLGLQVETQISQEAALLAALASLKENKRVQPWNAVGSATCTLYHLYFMFHFECEDKTAIEILQSKLTCTWLNEQGILIASGLFPQWREFIIDGCRADRTSEYRLIAGAVLIILKTLNLDEQFAQFKQEKCADGTIILKPRY